MGDTEIREKYTELVENLSCGWMTHGGIFHADDVFATALIRLAIEKKGYPERRNEIPDDYKGLAFDIGGGSYDHHQKDVRSYADGTPMASFGLLAEVIVPHKYGRIVYAELLDFIKSIDENDVTGANKTTGKHNEIASIVRNFAPAYGETLNMDDGFRRAVSFAETILKGKIRHIQGEQKASEFIQKMEVTGECIVLENYVPGWDKYADRSVKYAIYPSLRGGYNLQVRRLKDNSLPGEWLKNKPRGCTFVHGGLFIAAFESKCDAYDAMCTIEDASSV